MLKIMREVLLLFYNLAQLVCVVLYGICLVVWAVIRGINSKIDFGKTVHTKEDIIFQKYQDNKD